MDLFGNERRRLRAELEEARRQQEQAVATARSAEKEAVATARSAQERQARAAAAARLQRDRVVELERIIEDLRGEVHARQLRGAPAGEVSAAERALRDAQAIHSESTR